jgi:hypothetical protein
MIIVLKWYLTTVQTENWHKKPYNPVLGEIHEVHVVTTDVLRLRVPVFLSS